MRRIASALLAGSALAMIATAPAMARSPFDGAYVGSFVGYTDGDVDTRVGTIARDVGTDGFALGAYAGYGQTFDSFYLGAEGEVGYNWVDGEGTVNNAATTFDTDWTYGLSARAGYVVGKDVLVYGRVGYQWTNAEGTSTLGGVRTSFDETIDGWRYGGGVEVAVTDNLLARAEYNYIDYGAFQPQAAVGGNVVRRSPGEHALRVGLGYRF
ncbi:MAG: hypothetical protein RLY86_1968 [Pseudomonadota bacterium]|jgi:outer membrane immunogenic protein